MTRYDALQTRTQLACADFTIDFRGGPQCQRVEKCCKNLGGYGLLKDPYI